MGSNNVGDEHCKCRVFSFSNNHNSSSRDGNLGSSTGTSRWGICDNFGMQSSGELDVCKLSFTTCLLLLAVSRRSRAFHSAAADQTYHRGVESSTDTLRACSRLEGSQKDTEGPRSRVTKSLGSHL